jgi:DNA-binding CsgD family transcriptional regulator
MRTHELVGRDAQLATLTSWLGDATRLPGTVVLDGQAGIGKTTLVRATIAEARSRDFRVLEAAPAEPERELAYAGLGDLLGEALDDALPELPEPQRHALEVALLIRGTEVAPLDDRAVAVALLTALRALARSGPLLIAIDDIQWLDTATTAALQFALRRLRDEPIAILLARRSGDRRRIDREPSSPTGIERIEVGPLSIGATHAMIGDQLGMALSRPTLRRLHELSSGNPYYALELARAVRDGRLRLEPGEPLPPALDELVGARVRGLPSPTRSALAACAALSHPTLAVLESVSSDRETDSSAALAPALAAGVIEVVDGAVAFNHPLLASASYAALSQAERRALHARLASVVTDRLERARHLALSTAGPDATVAEEVESAAVTTFARGAAADGAELVALAMRLTPDGDDEDRARRRLLEAQYRFESGDTAAASRILEQEIARTPPGPSRAELLARLARVRHFQSDVGGGVELLQQALAEAGSDLAIRGDIEEGLAWGLLLMRRDLDEAWSHARSAVASAEARGNQVALAEALAAVAVTEVVHGQPPTDAMARALALEPLTLHLRVLRHPAFAWAYLLTCADELVKARDVYLDLQRRADERGDESALAAIGCHLSTIACLRGELQEAERLAREAQQLASQIGQGPTEASAFGRAALTLARRGDATGARVAAERSLAIAGGPDFSPDRPLPALARGGEHALWALGELELSEGNPLDADRYLGPLAAALTDAGVHEPGEIRFLNDEIEALVLLGRIDQADQLSTWLATEAERVRRPSVEAAAAAARGLVSAGHGDLEEATTHLEHAVGSARQAALPFELARILLLLGRVLRRAASKRAAREALAESVAAFERLGAVIWAPVAAADLGRIGGRIATEGGLTPTERRVAALVLRGLTNKEVAAELFVTTKAVEASLSRIYAKRGVSSRAELASLLATEAATGAS